MEQSVTRNPWFWGIGALAVIVALGLALYARGWVGGVETAPTPPAVEQTD